MFFYELVFACSRVFLSNARFLFEPNALGTAVVSLSMLLAVPFPMLKVLLKDFYKRMAGFSIESLFASDSRSLE